MKAWSVVLLISGLLAVGQSVQIDPSFDPGTGPNGAGEVNDIEVLADGKILVGGNFTSWNGTPHRGIVRLNADGSLDSSFDSDVPTAVQRIFWNDGVLWVQLNDTLYRLTGNGLIDSSTPPFRFSGMAVASGNHIYRVWVPPRQRPIVEHYNAAGQLQSMLREGSVGERIHALEPLPGGRLLVGGTFSGPLRFEGGQPIPGTENLAAFTPFGLDDRMVADAPAGVREIAVGPNSIYVAADRDTASMTLARLNSVGQRDPNFQANSGVVSAMAVTSDDRLVYANRGDVVRLNPDGTVDGAFNPEFDESARINALATQPDGRVLAAGSFSRVDGVDRNNIVRLLPQMAPLPAPIPPPDDGGTPPPDDGTPPPTGGFVVSGYVTDGATGIPGVKVRLRKQVTYTDENGAFVFTDVPARRYVLRANSRDYRIRPAIRRVRVNGDVSDIVFIAKERRRGR